MKEIEISFTITEFCQFTGLPEEELNEVVGLGLIEPQITELQSWLFDEQSVISFKRAMRLHKELELDWPGIAVALMLLTDNQQLRKDNQQLRYRLKRYEIDDND